MRCSALGGEVSIASPRAGCLIGHDSHLKESHFGGKARLISRKIHGKRDIAARHMLAGEEIIGALLLYTIGLNDEGP
jgi:hypothetical protein